MVIDRNRNRRVPRAAAPCAARVCGDEAGAHQARSGRVQIPSGTLGFLGGLRRKAEPGWPSVPFSPPVWVLAALLFTACNPPPTTTVTYAANDPSFPVTHWYGVMWHVEDATAAGLSPRDAMLAAICKPPTSVEHTVQQHTPFALQIGGSAGEWRGVAIEFERNGVVERIQVDRDCPPPPVWPTLTAEQVHACEGRGGCEEWAR